MIRLLKGGHCYVPEDKGIQDILIVCGKICRMESHIEAAWPDVEIINCTGMTVCPGFIDQHAHITGGGGEAGPVSRIPELMPGSIAGAGVTTLVGVLGVDDITRTPYNLLAKARGLEAEGFTTYMYTGSYTLPASTITGSVSRDIALIDKVVGVGEVALADHRSSHPTLQQLKELAIEAHKGGLVGGKPGIVHFHIGDGSEGMNGLFELIRKSEFPPAMFVPTHINRTFQLFDQGMEFLQAGGNMDITAGQDTTVGYSIKQCMKKIWESQKDASRITVSSDANGSTTPVEGEGDGVCDIQTFFDDIRDCLLDSSLDRSFVLRSVTSNVAKILGIYPVKGTLAVGSDADILVLNEDLHIQTLLVKGEIFMQDGKRAKKGQYEEL